MVQLTDKLRETTYTPSVIGGAGGSDIVGGLANVGAGLMDMFSKKQRADASNVDDNNPVLDDLASASFTILSGGAGNSGLGKRWLRKAERLQAGRDSGNIDGTKFDLAMKGMMGELMSTAPDMAEELLTYGAARGLDHYYFRERAVENKVRDNNIDQKLEADNTAFQYAASRGAYDPTAMTMEQATMRGYSMMAEDTADQMLVAERQKLLDFQQISQPWWDQKFREVNDQIVAGTMNKVYTTLDYGMEQVYAAMTSAGSDTDKLSMIDPMFDQALMDVDKMSSDIARALNNVGAQTITDPNTGEIRTVPVPEAALEKARAELATQKEVLVWLRNQPVEARKRWLEMTTLNSQVAAQEYVPTIMEMAQGLKMSVPQVLETLMVNPNMFNLGTKEASYVFNEMAAGAKRWSDKSLQFSLEMTNKGQSPSFSTDPQKALKGFNDNLNVGIMLGKSLAAGGITNETDLNATLEGFANNWSSIISYMRTNYNPSNINVNNANSALGSVFSPGSLAMIKAFETQGGDPQIAQLMGAQSAIAASTFVESLAGSSNVTYNQMTGKYVAKPVRSVTGYSAQQMDRMTPPAGLSGATLKPNPGDVNAANTLNGLLDYIETVHTTYPVLKEEFLKEGNTSVRDVAAMQGFDKYAAAVQAKQAEEAAIRRQEEARFQQGIQNFDFYKDGSFQLDNSITGDGGNRSAAGGEFGLNVSVPEDFVKVVDDAAAAEGVDPSLLASLLKNESNWNPNARGPKIPKYAGTEDEQAVGIAQFLPSTARDMGVNDPFDPMQAIPGAAKYLGMQLKQFNNDPILALMAYNWGPDNVQKWLAGGQNISKIPQQTREYVKRILGIDLTKGQ